MRLKGSMYRLLTAACAVGLAFSTFVRADQNKEPKADDVKKVEAALPDSAPAKPEKPRKVLIFGRATGFVHSSIPLGCKTIELLGKKTGGYDSVISYDQNMFEPDKLKEFDAIVLVSTTQNFLDDNDQAASEKRREALLDFVRGGKGLVGIHAASDAYYGWRPYGEAIGGYFNGHHAGNEKIAVVNEDPKNPVNAPFDGKNFEFADEIYRFTPKGQDGKDQTFSRQHVRVLLSVDVTKHENEKEGTDMPVAWIHEDGKGRVFYCSLGHNEYVYWDATIQKFYLAGIQYAIGDLKAEDAPTAKEKTASAK